MLHLHSQLSFHLDLDPGTCCTCNKCRVKLTKWFTSTLTLHELDDLLLEENFTQFRTNPDHLILETKSRGQLDGDSSRPTATTQFHGICKISSWPRNQSSRILTSQLTTKLIFTLTSSSPLTRSSSVLLLQGLENFQHSEGTGFETWDLESCKLVVGERSGEIVSESPSNLIKRPSVNLLLPVIYS